MNHESGGSSVQMDPPIRITTLRHFPIPTIRVEEHSIGRQESDVKKLGADESKARLQKQQQIQELLTKRLERVMGNVSGTVCGIRFA